MENLRKALFEKQRRERIDKRGKEAFSEDKFGSNVYKSKNMPEHFKVSTVGRNLYKIGVKK